MTCNLRDFGGGIWKLCIFVLSISRVSHKKNAFLSKSWPVDSCYGEKLQRLRICNGDVFDPVVRIFSGRLQRLEVHPVECLVSHDKNLTTLLDHTFFRFHPSVIHPLPRSTRLLPSSFP